MVNKKNKNRSTIDPRKGKKDPLADLKAEQRRKKKLKEQGSFNKGGTPGGIGSLAGKGMGRGLSVEAAREAREKLLKERFKEKRKKLREKPKTPLGRMKKPKPGSYDYQLQETMKPSYKIPTMDKGGVFSGDKKTLTRIERVRKAKGFRPGETPAQFNQRKALEKRAMEAAKATKIGKIVLPIAVAGVAAQQFLKSKMKKNEQKAKPKKKMGGGMMMQRPMGYKKGSKGAAKPPTGVVLEAIKAYTKKNQPPKGSKRPGKMAGGLTEATRKLKAQGMVSGGTVCRGMGAALRGGDFKGVK